MKIRRMMVHWLGIALLSLTYSPSHVRAQFGGPLPIDIQVFVEHATLPYNFFGAAPFPGNTFTSTITVIVERADGTAINSTDEIVGMSIDSGLESGALVFLDGDPAHEDDNGNQLLFSAISLGLNSGVASAHIFSTGPPGSPGEVVVGISVTDPNGGPTAEAVVTVAIESGSNTALPSSVSFDRPPGNFTLFTAGIGGPSQTVFNIQVVDDGGFPIPDPDGVDNLRMRFVGSRPNGGEFLSGTGVDGPQNGDSIDVQTSGGVAQVVLHAGTLPGTIIVEALVDRADNNVSDGLEIAIRDSTTIPIDDGVIRSISYSGPFVDAAVANQNVLNINGSTDVLGQDGIYSRGIEVLTSSRFGNPPIEGTTLTFRLIDGPLLPNTYPDCGRGEFLYTGDDANPFEGGRQLSTPLGGSTFNDIEIGCQILLEGSEPEQRMGRFITAILSPNDIEVSPPFPEHEDTGFTVNYTIGCPPYLGNVENSPGGFTAATDALGRVLTHLNYPASAIGHIFKASVEAQGGEVNQVVGSHYIGVQEGILSVASPANLQVLQDGSLQADLVLRLGDGSPGSAPVPAEEIQVFVDVMDSIKQFAEEQITQAILAQSTGVAARAEANVARAAAIQAQLDATLALAAAEAQAATANAISVISCPGLIISQNNLTSPPPGSEITDCVIAVAAVDNATAALAIASANLLSAEAAVVAAGLLLTIDLRAVTTCEELVLHNASEFEMPPTAGEIAMLINNCMAALDAVAIATTSLTIADASLLIAETAVIAANLIATSSCISLTIIPSGIIGVSPTSAIETCLDAFNQQTLADAADTVADRLESDADLSEAAADDQQSIANAAAQLDADTPDPVINISSPTQSFCVNEVGLVVIRTDASGRATLRLDIQNIPPELNQDLVNTIFEGVLSMNIGPGEVNITIFTIDFAAPAVQILGIQTGRDPVPTSTTAP